MSNLGHKQTRNIVGGKYYWELQGWINELFMKQDKCLICGADEDLQPHHIVKVKTYDKLYTDIDNGAVLCKNCHYEYHKLYEPEINAVTLLEYAKRRWKWTGHEDYKKLHDNFVKQRKANKYLKKENAKLKRKLDEFLSN